MRELPVYVPVVFVLTTLASAGLLYAGVGAGRRRIGAVFCLVVAVWLTLQAILASGGFYAAAPWRLPLTAVLPAMATIAAVFIFFRNRALSDVSVPALTLVHTVRIPVELVLFWLFTAGLVPREMTFAGWNYDILSGVLAVAAYIAARYGARYRGALIAFNIIGLILLATIVSIAVLSLPTPAQRLVFDQPNTAVLYFPFIWLPAFVVPVVLFSHLASLWKLFRRT